MAELARDPKKGWVVLAILDFLPPRVSQHAWILQVNEEIQSSVP
jgi:hypothetical protein